MIDYSNAEDLTDEEFEKLMRAGPVPVKEWRKSLRMLYWYEDQSRAASDANSSAFFRKEIVTFRARENEKKNEEKPEKPLDITEPKADTVVTEIPADPKTEDPITPVMKPVTPAAQVYAMAKGFDVQKVPAKGDKITKPEAMEYWESSNG